MTEDELKALMADFENFKESDLYAFLKDTMQEKYEGMMTAAGAIDNDHAIRQFDRAIQLKEDMDFILYPFGQ